MHTFKFVFFLIALASLLLQMQVNGDPFDPTISDCVPYTCCEDPCCEDAYRFCIQGRASAYFPTERKVRRIYSNVWGFYEGEIDVPLWCGLDGFFSAGYLENKGHSLCLHNKTRLQMVPLSLGLKYFLRICPGLDAYIGGGVVYSILKIRDHSPYVHKHVSKNRVGGTAKMGLTYFFCDNWFIDGSVDYLYQRFSFKHSRSSKHYVERHDLDMSGVKIGAGIGLAF